MWNFLLILTILLCVKKHYILLEVLPYNDFKFHWTALGFILSLLKFKKNVQCYIFQWHLAEFALKEDSLYYKTNNNWIYYLLNNTYISNVLCSINIQKRALWVIKYCYNYYHRKWLTHFSMLCDFSHFCTLWKNYKKCLDLFCE